MPSVSVARLSSSLRHGLIPLTLLALLSLCLLCFVLAYLLSQYPWKRQHRAQTASGQYVVLLTNLLLADLLQSAAMSVGLHWLRIDAILAPSLPCFLQGWLLHTGDVSSAMFVLLIALHTFAALSVDYRVCNITLYWTVAAAWTLALLLTATGVFMHGYARSGHSNTYRPLIARSERYFMNAGAWCWVSEEYETSRLFLHYFCESVL